MSATSEMRRTAPSVPRHVNQQEFARFLLDEAVGFDAGGLRSFGTNLFEAECRKGTERRSWDNGKPFRPPGPEPQSDSGGCTRDDRNACCSPGDTRICLEATFEVREELVHRRGPHHRAGIFSRGFSKLASPVIERSADVPDGS